MQSEEIHLTKLMVQSLLQYINKLKEQVVNDNYICVYIVENTL